VPRASGTPPSKAAIVVRQSADAETADAIEALIQQAPDRALCRINVLEFAAQRGLDEERAIAAFLHAARLGIFELSWNVLCPSCGGVIEASETLKSVNKDEYHCGWCAAGYMPVLDEIVEVTFTVNRRVRRIVDPVAVAVDHRLLEAERVDQEPDQGPGVVCPQGRPDLRLWRAFLHDCAFLRARCRPGRYRARSTQASPAAQSPAWTFRNSSAIHWLVQREDQGQEGGRQAPVASGRHAALPVAGVPGHVGTQRLGGHPAAVLVKRQLVKRQLVSRPFARRPFARRPFVGR
jgi:hypothetical protein